MPESALAEDSIYSDDEAAPVERNGTSTEPGACDIPGCDYVGTGVRAKQKLGLHKFSAHGLRASGAKKPPAREGDGAGVTAERRPRIRTPARVKLDKLGTNIWQGLAFVASKGGYPAAGRAFSVQAAAAGPAFEEAIRGSMADRFLQPVARWMDAGSQLGTLAALPVTAEAFVKAPSPMTQAAYIAALEASLPHIAKSIRDVKKRQEKLEADLAELAPEFGKQEGDTVTVLEIARWIAYGSTEGAPTEEGAEPAPAAA